MDSGYICGLVVYGFFLCTTHFFIWTNQQQNNQQVHDDLTNNLKCTVLRYAIYVTAMLSRDVHTFSFLFNFAACCYFDSIQTVCVHMRYNIVQHMFLATRAIEHSIHLMPYQTNMHIKYVLIFILFSVLGRLFLLLCLLAFWLTKFQCIAI